MDLACGGSCRIRCKLSPASRTVLDLDESVAAYSEATVWMQRCRSCG